MTIKTAVLFKTYLWNQDVYNQYLRAKNNAPKSDFYILYDNTNREIDIPKEILLSERVFLTSWLDAEKLGLGPVRS